jgi:dihydrolipoamide dehydrogenase
LLIDLCIIGAGPAGYTGAIRAAQAGLKVVLIERDKIGGTCLNRGCIPTKALRHSADVMDEAQNAGRFGVNFKGGISLDYAAVSRHRDGVVDKLVSGVGKLVKARKIDYIHGDARLVSPGRVEVFRKGESQTVSARNVVIATGSRPADLPGLTIDEKYILSSEGALWLKSVPQKLLVVGAGVIGCEFADIMASFGSSVTVVEVAERILLTEDRSTARTIRKSLESKGISFITGATVSNLEQEDGRLGVEFTEGSSITVDKIIVSVGRRPQIDGLGLEEIGVEVSGGAVKVDRGGRTSVPGVWAAGDVIGGPMLAHAAVHEVEVVIENIMGGQKEIDYGSVPSVVFTRPEVASVGVLEDAAKEKGLLVLIGRFSYTANGKALCMGQEEGLARIIVDKESGIIIGATIIGAHAGDLIHEIALAVKHKMKVADLLEVVHAHPTLAEIVPEAASDAFGLAIHKVGRPPK